MEIDKIPWGDYQRLTYDIFEMISQSAQLNLQLKSLKAQVLMRYRLSQRLIQHS
ncbi:hypothetical protein [Thermoanaerobacter mathranii]|uniref:hypothetical protein n=1 Tax=Thermoanaerobacter mathranii TaxID=583357 RepID=UPI003D6B1F37